MANEHRVEYAKEFLHGREDEHRRTTAQTINNVLRGKTNNYWLVSLDADETETEISVDFATVGAAVLLSGNSSNGAVALASGLVWAESQTEKIVIHHDASSLTDRNLAVVMVG